ncbi:ABC transporter ATP-binding protein [Candidatus Gracilibacteria bacterium]|nr:ABC transporter ATP-binding protein [Candidatus Gracilibacteria bacterium]NUJ98435.1 ABC transporter ATP-binding protein [Candidatus Gracilibacteria bacterium]
MSIIELHKVNKSLTGKTILHNLSFEVKQGDIYGFLGPNGAGKTTTMKCIMGLIKPESGTIKIFGEEGLTINARKEIGFMPENTYLYKHLTGREFLEFNGRFFSFEKDELKEKVKNLLKKVGLKDAGDKLLGEYSKGMLQRIGLAQAIINEPKLLFLDEPMSGLDPIGRKMVKDLLVELNQAGTTIFFNTHILADVESICHKVSIINKGVLVVESKKIKDIDGSLEDFFIESVS